jgi:hypothetical protein
VVCNIKKFDKVVAQIFEKLYSQFPVRIYVNPYEILDYEDKGKYVEGVWQETLSDEDKRFFIDTLLWLHETGYIIGSITHIHETRVTLSNNGLELMKYVPSSVDKTQSLGEQLQNAIKSGAKDSAANLVSNALSTNNVMTLLSSLFS